MGIDATDNGKPMCCAPGVLTECTVSGTKEQKTSDIEANLPQAKKTELGLYVTAQEAYAKWLAAPEQVKILDVRTAEEYLFVGSPTMAWRVPVAVQSYAWDTDKEQFPLQLCSDFTVRVRTIAEPGDALFVICRSGGRSAIACNLLAKDGFKNVYNIIDGMEGDANADSEKPPQGGWKNSGCPWTKTVTPERMVLPETP